MQPTVHRETLHHDTAALVGASASDVGRYGEALARTHLTTRDGAGIVVCNWRINAGELRGELDCVAVDHRTRQLVAIEVKCRVGAAHFDGATAAFSARKYRKVRQLAVLYRAEHAPTYRRLRIDLIAVDVLANRQRVALTHFVGVS